ncbi:MAG: acyltransferase family protein [Halioglobus sp.]
MTPPDSTTLELRYRADIDGLRAIAVGGVVLFHGGLGITGGFVGVDVFFVISGFLITSLIRKDLKADSFSVLRFWERRLRRILPALMLVVIATLIAGWLLLMPFQYLVVGQSAFALLAFASNIQFWRTTGYFDPLAEENPLLHTWSLSVEEQFYLLVPLLMVGLYRLGSDRWLIVFICSVVVGSFAFSVYLLPRDPVGAFYLLPSRAWELGLGALIAYTPNLRNRVIREIMSTLGLGLILYAFISYTENTPFPGFAALAPVAGAALLIWAGRSAPGEAYLPFVNHILTCRPIVFTGLVSYSFYLWHWPFFAYHRYVNSSPPDLWQSITYLCISFVISVGSYYFVEQNFRNRKFASTSRSMFQLSAAMAAVMMLTSLGIYWTGGMPQRVPARVLEFDSAIGDALLENDRPVPLESGGTMYLLGSPDVVPTVLVWGDSHALAMLSIIDEITKEIGISAIAATRGGIAPVLNWSRSMNRKSGHSEGSAFSQSVFNFLVDKEKNKIKQVVLVLFWSAYFSEQVTPAGMFVPPSGFPEALLATIRELDESGHEIAILLETPVFAAHVARATAMHHWRGFPLPHLTVEEHRMYNEIYSGTLIRIREEFPDVKLLDPLPYLLSMDNEVVYIEDSNQLVYRDWHHLTQKGSKRLAPLFKSVLEN